MMQDDEAVVTMVDSNLQREQITPSEKAYAYRMKYDAIKKKSGRKNRYVLYCRKREEQGRREQDRGAVDGQGCGASFYFF